MGNITKAAREDVWRCRSGVKKNGGGELGRVGLSTVSGGGREVREKLKQEEEEEEDEKTEEEEEG